MSGPNHDRGADLASPWEKGNQLSSGATLVTSRKPTYCGFTRLVQPEGEPVTAPESSALASADRRPYATLFAKGDDRKQRFSTSRQRLLARNGWRNTTLAQIARRPG